MPETRAKIKEYLAIIIGVIAILTAIGSFANTKAKNAVLQETVNRHETLLNQYNIAVMSKSMENVEEDVKEMKEAVKDLVKAFNAFVISQ